MDLPKPPTGAVWPPPGGWTPPPCELESTALVTHSGSVFKVRALLRNLTKAQLELDTLDQCPRGPANFGGLPEGYDYYRSCAAGACLPHPALHFSLAPGQSVQVAAIEIDPQQTSCNAPLAPGHYTLGFNVQAKQRVCGGKQGAIDVPEVAAKATLKPLKPKSPCPRGPACGIACPSGRYAHDANGCSVCGCEPDPFTK